MATRDICVNGEYRIGIRDHYNKNKNKNVENKDGENKPLIDKTNDKNGNFCKTKLCLIIGLTIFFIFVGGLSVLIYYGACELSGSTFKYCLCDEYTHNTPEIQTCDIEINEKHTVMNCMSRFGYWECNTEGHCPNNGGWGNCTYHESKTKRSDIATCYTYFWGSEICFNATKSCCWYSADQNYK